jgi:hypothetical protein
MRKYETPDFPYYVVTVHVSQCLILTNPGTCPDGYDKVGEMCLGEFVSHSMNNDYCEIKIIMMIF